MTVLRRYSEALRPSRLGTLLAHPEMLGTEVIGGAADLSEFADRAVAELAAHGSDRAKADAPIAEVLHACLAGSITRRDAGDMRFWHWMTVSQCARVVWLRWLGEIPDEPEAALTPALRSRFLGAATLYGVSRNALARLWWCAEALHSEDDGYGLMQLALERQDLFQNVFERRFGLYPPTAKIFIRRFATAREGQWREAAKRLDYRLSAITLESLDEADIQHLIDEIAALCGL